MKKWLPLFLFFSLCGCFPNPIIVDNGDIPETVLQTIPYRHGETYRFKHSNGLIINYKAARSTSERWTECHWGCKYTYRYQEHFVSLKPDYPTYSIYFFIDNQDSLHYHYGAQIGKFNFPSPLDPEQNLEKADSMTINSHNYYEVYKIKAYHDTMFHKDSIYVDSLYYNHEKGILKILISNKENYTLYE